ncbi:hypothetical protein Tiera_018 [Polaromonas phage Tiera]|nr:hypothetical protein Tiera_018 [Polaromonas phage Tiera]
MATANPVDNELYPLSTEKGDAIPLEVIRPLGVIPVALTEAGVVIEIPADWKIASFYSDKGCFVQFNRSAPADLINAELLEDVLWVPPGIVVATVIAGPACVVSNTAGVLVIQGMQKWAGIALKRMAVRS